MTKITFHKIDSYYGFLCNDYPSSFTINGVLYLTAEHYIQAHMAKYMDDRIVITKCKTPHLAIKTRKTMEIREDWDNIKIRVMLTALTSKFVQHPKLYSKLRDTGNDDIIHKSKDNILGMLLEYVRSDSCYVLYNLGFKLTDFDDINKAYIKQLGNTGYSFGVLDWNDGTFQFVILDGDEVVGYTGDCISDDISVTLMDIISWCYKLY